MTGSVYSKLQHLWEIFLQAPSASYTKSCWLDLFLAEFLLQVQNGANVNSLLSFWPAGQAGIATLIGCELLGSVHQICSAPGQTEELRPLRNLLLRERGWRCLAVLHILSLEGICCVRELASLLISLYPVCMSNNNRLQPITNGTPPEDNNPKANGDVNEQKSKANNAYVKPRETNIDQAIIMCGSLRHKTHTPQRKHSHIIPPHEYSNSNTSSSGKGRRSKTTRDSVQDSGSLITTTTDSEVEENSLEALNRRSLTLKIQLNPMDFDYFTSVVRDEDDDNTLIMSSEKQHSLDQQRYYNRSTSKKQLSHEDFMTDQLKLIIDSEISQFEFSIVVVQLLQSLCLSEIHNLNDNNPPITIQCINFALENLCSLQFGSAPTEHLQQHEIYELKSAMTQLMLIALEKIVKHPDISMMIINNGILPIMLRILEDITNKHESSVELDKQLAQKLQEFIFGIMYGVTTFLYHQLLHRSTVDKIKDFLELFRLFSDSQGGRLIEKTLSVILSISNVDSSVTYNRAKKIIDFLGQFIVTLKKSRSEIIHSYNCHKSRHKQCRMNNLTKYYSGKHHHQDLFGAVYTPNLMSSSVQHACCISTLFMIFVRLLQNAEIKQNSDLQIRLIKIMILSGTCCCFPAKRLMSSVTKMLHGTQGKIRPLAFTLLERTLYTELGGIITSDTDNQCAICSRQIIADNQSMKYCMSGEAIPNGTGGDDNESLWSQRTDSFLASYYNPSVSSSNESTTIEADKFMWNFLEQYHSLINSTDMKLSYAATSHLLRVAPRSTPRVRYELLFRVFFPTFLSAKEQFLTNSIDEHAKFKILTSLSLFASLLSSVPFAEQFVNLGGLNHIIDLVERGDFSKSCCAVLENTVIIEIWKLESELNCETIHNNDNSENHLEIGNDDNMKKLPSLNMLLIALERATREIGLIFQNGILDFLSANDDDDAEEKSRRTSVTSDEDTDQTIRSIYVSSEDIINSSKSEHFIRLLHNCSVFWRTTASLCLYSPYIRQYVATHSINHVGTELLWKVLQRITKSEYICDSECNSRERRLLMKILEAILTVKLTAPTNEMSLVHICRDLRDTILTDSALITSSCVAELCDVLLRCAILRPSPDQVMPPHSKPKMPILDTAIHWEDEATIIGLGASRRLAFSDSSLADAYVTADEGYEADVEVPEYSGGHCSRYEITVSLADSCSSGDSIPQLPACDSASPGFVFAEYCRTKSIVHPNLCLLALDLFVTLNKNQNGNQDDTINMHVLDDILLCLQRLLSLCRDNPHNCIALAYAGTIAKLLIGFKDCLVSKSTQLIEVQHAILELITLLSKHSITRFELALYLQLFKAEDPPLGLLLDPLVALATSSRPQPNHILCFPSTAYTNIKNSIINENSALILANNLRAQHSGSEQSAWTNYAVCLPINNEVGWSMWTHGYSCCFWMRHEQPGAAYAIGKRANNSFEQSEQLESSIKSNVQDSTIMHLVSIGNDALMVEMWADSANEQLIFRLSRPELKSNRIISEQIIPNCIPTGQWHNLALNVRDNIQKRKIVIEVTLLINGWKEVIIKLPVVGLLPKLKRTCVLLGQICSNNTTNMTSSWFFGNLMLFRTPVFTKERAIYLVGLGPNYTSLTECEVGKQIPNFTSIFGPRTISSVIDWDSILDAANGNLKELQDNLLLSYNAQHPNFVHVYPQMITNPGGTVGNLFHTSSGFRVQATTDQRACQQLPLALAPEIIAPLVPQHFQGLGAAASLLGGVPVFMFLFARVVELKGNGIEQGLALRLLLRLVQVDSELHAQFQQQDGYQLLLRVLSSSRCEPSQHILKAILDICCDKPVLHYHCNNETFNVLTQTDAIIVNPNLIKAAVGGWHAWDSEALIALLSVLHSLLRDDHPFREFNAAQLNRVHLVEALLSVCKEHFLYEENETTEQLPSAVCCSIVELVRSLMGAPPEFCHIVAVIDFLLLLHQASATYVTHVRSSFYYLLNDAIPPGQNASNPLSLPSVGTESVSDTNSLTHPVDPRKLNKALTNLKIQQRGSSDSSSKRSRRRKRNVQNMDTNRAVDVTDSGIAGSYKELTSSDPDNNGNESILMSKDHDEDDFVMIHSENQSDANIEVIEHSVIKRTPEYPTISGLAALRLYEKSKNNEVNKENSMMNGEHRNKSKLSEQIKSERIRPLIVKERQDVYTKSQWLVTEGLLLLLRDTLLVLPDTMSTQVLCHVVKPELLLVMANHPAPYVRTALIKVLAAFLQRSSEEELNKFIKNKYFYHLANQLSLFSSSRDLASACGSLITRCTATLEEQIELAPWTDLSSVQLAALPPLLALLPKSINDPILTRDLLTFITHIFTRATNAFRALLDKGLVEVLLRTLLEVLHHPQRENSILTDLVALLVNISSRCLSMSGTHNMQIVLDMHLQLHYLTLRERKSDALAQSPEFTLRAQQCALFDGQLDALQERLTSYHKAGFKLRTTASYLASVLSTSYDQSDMSTSPKHTPGRAHRIPHIPSPSGLQGNVSNLSNSISLLLGTSQQREIPKTELCERLKTLLIKCVEFIVNTEPVGDVYSQASITETKLVRRVLLTLLQGLSNTTSNDTIPWRLAVWNSRGALRKPTAELVVWLMAPGQPIKLRMFAIHSIREERNCRELINTLLQTHPQIEQKFTIYLWDLMYNTGGLTTESDSSDGSPLAIVSGGLSSAEIRVCEDLKEDLQCWGILSPHSIGHAHDQWQEEVRLLSDETNQERNDWIKQNNRGIYRSIYKWESLTRSLTENAMAITRTVVESQNRERKSFMEYMKLAYTERLHAHIRWQQLIQQLTHERAVWYFPESYPQSWQLDPTEGPHRVRTRLQRCHLNISERFLLPEHRNKLASVTRSQPLSYLMKLEQQSSASSLLIERLHTSEKVRHMCTAQVITPAIELPGELLIGECSLHFVPDDTVEQSSNLFEIKPTGLDLSCMKWQFENIREIHNRRFQLQERALEIFLTNGKTYLVAFPTSKDRDDFVQQLSLCHLPNRVQGDVLNDSIQLWRQGLLTNWEYITQLNKMAGRSYNDLMQYPVFPFVLADYVSEEIDLCDHRIYRNFKKPMAVQDKKNEQHYINNYNYLKQAIVEGMNSISLNKEPYHYGSHYSNSGTVLHFLVRLPPFTKMFLSYQDNNFDIPDRTFHALHTTWRLTSCDSTTDVKELIPEFFYLSEFLQNNEGFNLGVRQNGERVNDVQLPPWSKGDARIFTLVHRQALESDYVRENTPHWIDLVFGYKQTGKAAIEAINVFHPATYYGFNVENIKDPIERNAWETMVRTYGQTPRQLFRAPHPMIVQPLTNIFPSSVQPVLEGVQGLRWGSYVGTPEQAAPVAIWKRQYRSPVATLVPISSNDVYGLAPQSSILLGYTREKDVTVVGTVPVSGSALITWGHTDKIVRVKLKKEQHAPWPLVQSPALDPMTICASVPEIPQLWLGHNSGSIHVYTYTLLPDRATLKPDPSILLGHTGPITTLALCSAFSIAVSGSQDGTAIIWDLNTLSFVRSIEIKNKETPVNLVTISDTLGDIAISYNDNNLSSNSGSILSVYTINCAPVKEITVPERVTAMCYSRAPEGVSVNVLATGFANGIVRLWSSWDLAPVRDITCPTLSIPIISIAYSYDSQHLFVSASDGTVIIWENANATPGRTPKFINVTSP